MAIRRIAGARSECPGCLWIAALVLAQLAGLAAGGQAALGAALTCVGLLLVLRRHGRPCGWLASLALGLLSAAGAAPRGAAYVWSEDQSYTVKVDDAPRYRKVGGVELSLLVLASESEPGRRLGYRLLCRAPDLPWRNLNGILPGSAFVMRARFRPIPSSWRQWEYSQTLRRHGYSAQCNILHAGRPRGAPGLLTRLRERIQAKVRELGGDDERSGLFLSMAIGTRDQIAVQTEAAFQAAGLSHLLVVSGFQVMLVYHAAERLAARLLTWAMSSGAGLMLLPQLCALASACFFVGLCGLDGSSARAAFAGLALAVARALERPAGFAASLSTSLLALSLIWPGAILEPGIQLTYAALLGIWVGCLGSGASKLVAFARVSFFAYLFTSIVSFFWFGMLAPAGFLMNPLAAPAASLIGCTLGLPAIALAVSGLDGQGIALRCVLAPIGWLRDTLLGAKEWMVIYKPASALERSWVLAAAAGLAAVLAWRRISASSRERLGAGALRLYRAGASL